MRLVPKRAPPASKLDRAAKSQKTGVTVERTLGAKGTSRNSHRQGSPPSPLLQSWRHKRTSGYPDKIITRRYTAHTHRLPRDTAMNVIRGKKIKARMETSLCSEILNAPQKRNVERDASKQQRLRACAVRSALRFNEEALLPTRCLGVSPAGGGPAMTS